MAANADPKLSTITSPAGAVRDGLPVVVVYKTTSDVSVEWGKGGAQRTFGALGGDYSVHPYNFHAVDSDGNVPLVKAFGSLLHCEGGILTIRQSRYRINVIQQQQQPDDLTTILEKLEEMQVSQNAKADRAYELILKQKQDFETIVISRVEKKHDKVVSGIGVKKNAAVWSGKPERFTKVPSHHTWLLSKEDSPPNQAAYMAYLRNTKNLVFPHGTKVFDGTEDEALLSVEMIDFGIKTSGNIDVPIVEDHHQSLATVKQNMLGALELKKDSSKVNNLQIERQVTLQHMAASYLNPDTGFLTIMTDLNRRWHFFWFVEGKELMRYNSTPAEARYLIEHMLDEPGTVSTPTGFLSRASWNDLFPVPIEESANSIVNDDEHSHGNHDENDKDSTDDPNDDTEASLPQHGKSPSLSKTNQTNRAGTRGAKKNQDELASSLEFLDKEEELEAVMLMATKTSFHRMLGPLQNKPGSFPPSRIECTL